MALSNTESLDIPHLGGPAVGIVHLTSVPDIDTDNLDVPHLGGPHVWIQNVTVAGDKPFSQTDWPLPQGRTRVRRQQPFLQMGGTYVSEEDTILGANALPSIPRYGRDIYESRGRYAAMRFIPQRTPDYLSPADETLPAGKPYFPDRFIILSRFRAITSQLAQSIHPLDGWDDLSGSHFPSIPKFNRDVAIARQSRVAVKSHAEVWQNLLPTLLSVAPEDPPVGKAVLYERPRTLPPRQFMVSGDAQLWLTTPGLPEGKSSYPARLPHPRYRQYEPYGLNALYLPGPAAVLVPLTLVINSNVSDAIRIDTNPSDVPGIETNPSDILSLEDDA